MSKEIRAEKVQGKKWKRFFYKLLRLYLLYILNNLQNNCVRMFQLKRLYVFKRYFKPVLFVYFLYIHTRVHKFIAISRVDSYKSIISNRRLVRNLDQNNEFIFCALWSPAQAHIFNVFRIREEKYSFAWPVFLISHFDASPWLRFVIWNGYRLWNPQKCFHIFCARTCLLSFRIAAFPTLPKQRFMCKRTVENT